MSATVKVQEMSVVLAAQEAIHSENPRELLATAALAAITSPDLQTTEWRLRRLAARDFLQTHLEDAFGPAEVVLGLEWPERRVQVQILIDGTVVYTIGDKSCRVPKPSLQDLQRIVDDITGRSALCKP